MTRKILIETSLLLLLVACKGSSPPQEAPKTEVTETAKTRRDTVVDELFGKKVADPYRWLEDEKADEVQKWMASRDKEARSVLTQFPERDALLKRYKELVYVESRSAPVKRGERLFFTKKPADQEKSIYFYQEGTKGEPKVLLDPNRMSTDGSVSVRTIVPDHKGKNVAYLKKESNKDESTLYVMDVETKKVFEKDVIKGLRYTEPSWTPDGKGFYYTWLPTDPNIPIHEKMGFGEVRYHALGTDPAKDPTVREKTGDPQRWLHASVSRDGKYLILGINRGWAEADYYVQFLEAERVGAERGTSGESASPIQEAERVGAERGTSGESASPIQGRKPKWRPLAVGTKALYRVVAYKGVFYIATNKDAPRWQIYAVKPKDLEKRDRWKLIVPEDKEAVLEEISVIGGHLALDYLKNATSVLQVHNLHGKLVRQVKLPSIGTASSLVGNEDEDTAYFSFSSFTYPNEIYQTSIKSGETELFSKVDVPVKPADFVVEQKFYASKDGTKVSMFLVHKKDLKKDGSNKALLYGYGGFNISLTSRFTAFIYPWIERGGVYAVPNLRGGGEYGEEWHKAGMLQNKQNVFDDFIAAGEWLVKEGYTSASKLAIRGGSNGGLLVGAAMIQRPKLFRAVICAVPLLDMLRYHLFGVGKAWIPEYGNPEIKEEFEVLHTYSPYHHVQESAYPALLMLSADSDDRVDPMHARKFTAAIEAASTSKMPNLLRIESKSGHGGADMRKKSIERATDEMSFLLTQLK